MRALTELTESLVPVEWGDLGTAAASRCALLVGAEQTTRTASHDLADAASRTAQSHFVGERILGCADATGGHLTRPVNELLSLFCARISDESIIRKRPPASYVLAIMDAALCAAQEPQMDGCLFGLALCCFVSDVSVFVWRVGSNGVWHGRQNGLACTSEDHRTASLIAHGVVKPSPVDTPTARASQKVTSLFNVTTTGAWETALHSLDRNEVLILLNRGAHPFGPLPSDNVSMSELFALDAAWRHGFPSHGVVTAHDNLFDNGLTESWPGSVHEIGVVQ